MGCLILIKHILEWTKCWTRKLFSHFTAWCLSSVGNIQLLTMSSKLCSNSKDKKESYTERVKIARRIYKYIKNTICMSMSISINRSSGAIYRHSKEFVSLCVLCTSKNKSIRLGRNRGVRTVYK